MSNDKAIRVISFSGKKDDWRKWSRKFLAMSVKRGYKDVLQGKLEVEGIMNEKEQEKNGHAYNDLMLSMNEDVSFGIVDEAVTTKLPEGDCALAWRKLEAKYDSQTNSSKVKLMNQLNKSRLKDSQDDPDHWVSELEVIRTRLKKMNVQIEDDYFMIHILNNLPQEYDQVVDSLEDRIDAKLDPLTLEILREKLSSKYEKLQDAHKEKYDEREDEDAALAGFGNFKGRCYICGKFGHKGADCPEREKNLNRKFSGKCNYCGKKGHKEADCWKKKRDMENERRDAIPSSNIAADDSTCQDSDSDLSLLCNELKKIDLNEIEAIQEIIEETSLLCFTCDSDEERRDIPIEGPGPELNLNNEGQVNVDEDELITEDLEQVHVDDENDVIIEHSTRNENQMIDSSDEISVQGEDNNEDPMEVSVTIERHGYSDEGSNADRIQNDEIIEWFQTADMRSDIVHTPFGILHEEDVYSSSSSDEQNILTKKPLPDTSANRKVKDEEINSEDTAGWGPQPTSFGWKNVKKDDRRSGKRTPGGAKWGEASGEQRYRSLREKNENDYLSGEVKEDDHKPSIRKFTEEEHYYSERRASEWHKSMIDVTIHSDNNASDR